jgi:rubrerythrin
VQAFNADEVFAMAEQIERDGAAYYRQAAEKALDPQVGRMLIQLADMEDAHERDFKSLREQLDEEDALPVTFDPASQTQAFLQAMVYGKVFDREDAAQQIPPDADLDHVLRVAIELEKDSVVFYAGAKQMVPPNRGQDMIERIIREELDHIGLLARYLGMLAADA